MNQSEPTMMISISALSTRRRFMSVAVVISCVQLILCHAQQAPFYTTAKFAPNVTHRQDVCDRQKQLYNDEIALPDALRGLNLSVVLTNYKESVSPGFFTLVDGVVGEDDPGTFAVIIDELARRAGFGWRDSYGVVDPIDPEVDGNRTWSDLLEWEVNTYDVSVEKWGHTLDRMKREISFPEGWYDASIILVESTDSSDSLHLWSFLEPFKWGVWALIILTVIVTGLMYFLLDRMNSNADERRLESAPSAAVFYSFITMTGHFEFRPQTTAARLLTFSLTFFALIIVAVYTANLVSFMVVRNTPAFKIESIEEAVVLRAPICVEARTQQDEYLSENYSKAVVVRKPNQKEVFWGLITSECQVAAVPVSSFDLFRQNSEINADCSLSWQGRVEVIVPAGVATAVDTGILCSSLISYVLDYHLLAMKSDGFIDMVWEEHVKKVEDNACQEGLRVDETGSVVDAPEEEDTYSLSIKELAGIFIIHVCLTFTAILIAVFTKFRKTTVCNAPGQPDEVCQLDITGSEHELIADSDSTEGMVGTPSGEKFSNNGDLLEGP